MSYRHTNLRKTKKAIAEIQSLDLGPDDLAPRWAWLRVCHWTGLREKESERPENWGKKK